MNRIDKLDQNGKKPDFMIGTKVKSKELYFFFVEVKIPETTSKYQPEDNYTKLMKHIKGFVDEQLRLLVENPSSLGLLVEGMLTFCASCTKKKRRSYILNGNIGKN